MTTIIKPRSSLSDIALACGVSTATVSRVVNNSGYVSPGTRQAVESAIASMGYVANGAARTLSTNRSGTIGALVTGLSSSAAAGTIDTFQAIIEEAGFVLLLAGNGYDAPRAHRNVETMVSRGVDGIFLITAGTDDETLYLIMRQHRVPFLTATPNLEPKTVPYVGYDHHAAGRLVADFLMDLGHRDVVILRSSHEEGVRRRERVEAIRTRICSAPHGATVGEVDVPTVSLAGGRDGLRLLQTRGPLPSAVIATSDILAAGMIQECNRQGIRVPDDMSVMGYGDLDISEHISPSLTTIRLPKSEIGAIAAGELLAASRGAKISSHNLAVQLVVRESTSAPAPRTRRAALQT